jgi:L-asparaginase/Glu-tRNA(Gln) amidotransferase subunit D
MFGHCGDSEGWAEGTKEMLDDMHKRKIDMADEILVINVGGYIGSSTRSEIEYAHATGKAVRFLETLE